MSAPIKGVASDVPAQPASPPATSATDKAKHDRALEEAARQFEGIFVRSLLKESPLAGKGDAYGDIAVNAMAEAVTQGKGLGLADVIRHAVDRLDHTRSPEKSEGLP